MALLLLDRSAQGWINLLYGFLLHPLEHMCIAVQSDSTVECPKRSATTLGLTPSRSKCVAWLHPGMPIDLPRNLQEQPLIEDASIWETAGFAQNIRLLSNVRSPYPGSLSRYTEPFNDGSSPRGQIRLCGRVPAGGV